MSTTRNKKTISDDFEKTSPGRLALLKMIEDTTPIAQAMCLTCLRLAELSKRHQAFLLDVFTKKLKEIDEGKITMDAECERLPMEQWLSFLNGFVLGIAS